MKDKQDKTIKSPVWTQQKRDERGRFLSVLGTKPEPKLYTENDLAQAFLSGTKQAREVVEIVKPDHETLKLAFYAGMNASKSGIVTPSVQFDRWLKHENL